MKQKLYIRSWLMVLLSILAITSKAQTVNISGYSSSGTESGYPLFNVAPGEITVSSTSGQIDYVSIDNNQVAYNNNSYWSSYNINLSSYCDGISHRLQLKKGSSNYGICYFKVVMDESNLKDGLYFSINGENAILVTALSDIETAIIPETFIKDGISYPVNQIGNNAFYGKTNLSSVTIPNSITSIGNSAFYGCSGLTSLTIPSTVIKIGVQAFNGCIALKEVTFSDCENSIELGYDTYISFGTGKGLFADCPIETLYVGRTYTITNYSSSDTYNSYPQRYGYSPFPSTISTLTIGNNVTSIPAYFLYNGSHIESLSIPNSVTSIGDYAFFNTELTTLEFNAQNCTYCGTSRTPAFPSTIKTLTIGDNVTSIPDYFLYNGSSATMVNNLVIPNSVTYIGYNALDCKNSIILGSGLKTLRSHIRAQKAFWLGNTPPMGYLETNCRINYVPNDLYEFRTIKELWLFAMDSKQQLIYPFLSSYFIVDGIMYIPVNPSERICDIVNYTNEFEEETLNIEENVVYKGINMKINSIGYYAFDDNEKIKNININFDGILKEGAFRGCKNLEEIQFNTKMPFIIPQMPFYNCVSLKSFTFPGNLLAVEDYAFEGCYNIKNMQFHKFNKDQINRNFRDFEKWSSTNHGRDSYSDKTFTFAVSRGDVLSIDYIIDSEGYNDVFIIDIDGEIIHLEAGDNKGRVTYVFNATRESTCKLYYYKDDSVNMGQDMVEVIKISLNDANVLKKLFLGSNSNRKRYGEYDSTDVGIPLFNNCHVSEIVIDRELEYSTFKSRGLSPFYQNGYLSSVEITDVETQIYDNEFYGCSNLSSLKIGNGVKTIGNWAFSGCSSLDYFSAGYMVESIGTEAFSDCTGLTKYYSYSIVPPVCGEQALDDINKWDCTLYVPDESSDEYQAAPQWKDFFFIEEMDAVLVAELRLNLEEVTLAPSNTVQLTAQVLPTNATDKSLIWSSSNPEIANVNSDGLVTALADGIATIIVKSADGNSESTCVVMVDSEYNEVESIFNDSKWSKEVYNLNGYKVSDSTDNLAPGIYIVRQGAKTYKISVK